MVFHSLFVVLCVPPPSTPPMKVTTNTETPLSPTHTPRDKRQSTQPYEFSHRPHAQLLFLFYCITQTCSLSHNLPFPQTFIHTHKLVYVSPLSYTQTYTKNQSNQIERLVNVGKSHCIVSSYTHPQPLSTHPTIRVCCAFQPPSIHTFLLSLSLPPLPFVFHLSLTQLPPPSTSSSS